jgi:hypothetical protein
MNLGNILILLVSLLFVSTNIKVVDLPTCLSLPQFVLMHIFN